MTKWHLGKNIWKCDKHKCWTCIIEAEPKFGPWMDIVTIYIVPFGAVLGAFSIYYILGYKEIRQELELARKPLGAYFGITAKYIYVPLTIIIFVLGIIYGGI